MFQEDHQIYDRLIKRMLEIALLDSCQNVLGWDAYTHMPKAATSHRGRQQTLMAGMLHRMYTDPEIGAWLDSLEKSSLMADATSVPAVNIREFRRKYDRLSKIPRDIIEEQNRLESESFQAWVRARQEVNFAGFLPFLERAIQLKQAEAEALRIGRSRYDAALDEFAPGETSQEVGRLFSQLRPELVALVQAIRTAPKQPDITCLRGNFPIERQRTLIVATLESIGIGFEETQLDVTAHPLCFHIGPGDVRITTRYDAGCFTDAFFSTLHEAGHALYAHGLPAEYYGMPMGQPASTAIHESQSRLWENFVGRSREFWHYFWPKAQAAFPESLADVSLDTFHFAINKVSPSLIRIEADEVSYNLHIMLRFELESALINGTLLARDLPQAWNELFGKYFGLTPPNDALGCLQDVHWSGRWWGYFPTYTMGNLYAAQIFARVHQELPDLPNQISRGEFAPLLAWLRRNIHSQGMRYSARELIQKVSGQPLSANPLLIYLREKYGPLYGM
jgi:carboxypeptidase Taq